MTRIIQYLLILLAMLHTPLLLNSCVAQRMRAQARHSQVVVLDIGHFADPTGKGVGARTPDKRYGYMDETVFWNTYAIYTKQILELNGYTCIITNRGAMPQDKALAAAAKKAGVIHLNTPQPDKPYRSRYHPKRVATGMLPVDYGLDQRPACLVFLHLNSSASTWQDVHAGAFFTNAEGEHLSTCMAEVMNETILNHGMPNGGKGCKVVIRNDGRLGGGDWLNACNDSYVPASIVEVAFLNNPAHVKYLHQSKNAVLFAQAVGLGILKHLQTR